MANNTTVLVAFGSNLGDEESIFQNTQNRLSGLPGIDSVVASSLHRTAPVGGPADQPDYLNAAFRFQTELGFLAVHQGLIEIETALGRERRVRWGARRVDLDLLMYGDLILSSDSLTIPHPRMSFRRFVLEPANEIASEMVHPVAGRTIAELLQHLNSKPPEILWVTPNRAEAQAVSQRLKDCQVAKDWNVRLVDNVEDFRRHEAAARLVAWADVRPPAFQAIGFSGPQIQLPSVAERIETELLAAIEAMTTR